MLNDSGGRPIDVRFVLSKVRPGIYYHWKGGEVNEYAAVDWVDRGSTRPTEQEIIDAWEGSAKAEFDTLENEEVKIDTARDTFRTLDASKIESMTNEQLTTVVRYLCEYLGLI